MPSNLKSMNTKIRFLSLNLFICFVCIYLLSSSHSNAVDTDASKARYLVTESIVERSDLAIPDSLGIKGVDGRDYSWYGLGQSILAIPFYIIGKYVGTPENAVSIMNPLFGAATVVLVFLFSIALGYSNRNSLYAAILYGLCTFAWPLAKQPFDHTMETFFVLLSVYLLYVHVSDRKPSYLLLSAFSIGCAFIIRQISILVLSPLLILILTYSLKKSHFKTAAKIVTRDIALFFLAFLPFVVLDCWYNYYRFASIFKTGFTVMASRYGIHLFEGTPFHIGFAGLLISPGKGFFYYSPIAILFFFSIKSFSRKHPRLAVSFIFIILSYLLLLSNYVFWHGDWAWGPRFLLVITPFLIIPIAEFLESNTWSKNLSSKVLLYILIAVSFVIQISAVSVFFANYFSYLMSENHERFSITEGVGVQPTIVPPTKIYFDWHKSPILAQFRFIYRIARGINDYEYSELPKDATVTKVMKADPFLNVFDFWWLYSYFVNGSYFGFIVALLLLLLTIYYASRLRKISAHD
jgi:hypothetical protein